MKKKQKSLTETGTHVCTKARDRPKSAQSARTGAQTCAWAHRRRVYGVTGEQAHRRTDEQAHGQVDTQFVRAHRRLWHRRVCAQTCGRTDTRANRHTGEQTHGRTDTRANRHTGSQTLGSTDARNVFKNLFRIVNSQ